MSTSSHILSGSGSEEDSDLDTSRITVEGVDDEAYGSNMADAGHSSVAASHGFNLDMLVLPTLELSAQNSLLGSSEMRPSKGGPHKPMTAGHIAGFDFDRSSDSSINTVHINNSRSSSSPDSFGPKNPAIKIRAVESAEGLSSTGPSNEDSTDSNRTSVSRTSVAATDGSERPSDDFTEDGDDDEAEAVARQAAASLAASPPGISFSMGTSYASSVSGSQTKISTIEQQIKQAEAELARIKDLTDAKLAELRSLSVVQQYATAKKSLKPFSAKSGVHKSVVMIDNTSRIRICDKIKLLAGPDYEMYNCVVDGWCCLLKQYSDTVDRTYDWMKEVKLLEALPHHPNIVSYFFHDIIKAKLCVLTSWYPSNLQAIVQKRRQSNLHFTPEEMKKMLIDILKGLEFLHSYSIIHRNLSLANIFVLFDDRYEVSKLAIANLDTAKIISGKINAKTGADELLSAPQFLAPEVFTAKVTGSYGFAADVWSFGMIVYSLLTLQIPFTGIGLHELRDTIERGNRPSLQEDYFGQEYKFFIDLFKECTTPLPEDRPRLNLIRDVLMTGEFLSVAKTEERLRREGSAHHLSEGATRWFDNFVLVGGIASVVPENTQFVRPRVIFSFPQKIGSIDAKEREQIIQFCFPTGGGAPISRVKRTQSRSVIHAKLFSSNDTTHEASNCSLFLLRDKNNVLKYGICVYDDEPLNTPPNFIPTAPAELDSLHVTFTRRCYCFITQVPAFAIHFHALWQMLVQEKLSRISNFEQSEKRDSGPSRSSSSDLLEVSAFLRLLDAYYHYEVPKRGLHTIDLTFSGVAWKPLSYTIGTESHMIASWCMPCLFRVMTVEMITTVFLAALLEQKIILVSENQGVLSACVIAANVMLRPYIWQHPFIPVLPDQHLAMLQGSNPFIIGCLKRPDSVLLSKDELIIDIGSATVELPKRRKGHSKPAFPDLPDRKKLRSQLQLYWEAVHKSYPNPNNPCVTSKKDEDKDPEIALRAFGEFHGNIAKKIAASPLVDLAFKFEGNEIKLLAKSMPSTERKFFKEFMSTALFKTYSSTLLMLIQDIRIQATHKKQIDDMEAFFLNQMSD